MRNDPGDMQIFNVGSSKFTGDENGKGKLE